MTFALSLVMVLPLVAGASDVPPTVDELVPSIDIFTETGQLGDASLTDLVKTGLNIFFAILGVIAVVIILWAGFKWMTAQGEPDKIKDAKNMIYGGISGLVIVFLALAITNFVIDVLSSATNTNLSL